MSYDFDTLFQEYITETGPDAIFGPPTIEGFIDSTYALIEDAIDDGKEIDPSWSFIIKTYDDMKSTDAS